MNPKSTSYWLVEPHKTKRKERLPYLWNSLMKTCVKICWLQWFLGLSLRPSVRPFKPLFFVCNQDDNLFPCSFSCSVITVWRCPWCNCYRRRKWTRRHEFKSWTRLIAFHIALIPLGKVWIQLFSLQLWVNSRTD